MKNKLTIFLLLLFLAVVGISGCTSTTQTLNYSDGYISFQYPSDFQNTSAPGDLYSGSSKWTNIAFFANSDKTDISVTKLSDASGATPETMGPISALSSKAQGETLLASARYTNPNGVQMWKIITTLTDPTMNTERIYYSAIFNQGSSMYNIQVYGDKSQQSSVQSTADTVFNSTKV